MISLEEINKLPYKEAKNIITTEFKISYITSLLIRNHGNISHSDMDRKTIHRFIKEHDIDREDYSDWTCGCDWGYVKSYKVDKCSVCGFSRYKK